MILNRSPFYFNVPFPNNFVESVDFTLEVGKGSLSALTVDNTYAFTKLYPGNNATNTWLDISPYIRDNYNPTPIDTTGYVAAEVIASGEALLTIITATLTDSLGSELTPLSQKFVCTDGYGYYREGQNKQPSNKILLSHQEYKAYSKGYFIVPLNCSSGDGNPTVNGVAVNRNFTDDVTNYIKYLIVPLSGYTNNVEVVYEGASINVEIIEECKYDIKAVQFLNRFGVLESMDFYKASKESITVESKDFKNNYTNGVSYDTNVHQLKRFNVTSNKMVNVETGFLNPNYNTTIEELLQSEFVWLNGVPVNVKTSSLEYKTRIVDKLISYSIDFEYAFDNINNV